MKNKWMITILTIFLSIGLLTACNAEKRDALNEDDNVNFRPVRYERKTNENESNNDYKNRENSRFPHNENPHRTKDELE
ncbi:hypothetical protein ABC255_14605 [Neobacillus sp. 3P2-tot-E-2]|uniref:hypothetical protein n=1 Tax=Neobacillus sp. 3P2-tot-E-2 TaxID=3132212 RepID=UPI0039A1CA52